MTVINRLLLIAGALLLLALIGGHLNSMHPALDSLSHFRLHLAAAGIGLAIALVLMRNTLGASALGVMSLLSFGLTVWPTLAGSKEAVKADGPAYRLVQANLRFDNRTPEEFLRLIAAQKPDIITLQEVSDLWLPKLSTVKSAWPHQKICPGTNRVGGIAILSRRPFADGGLSFCGNSGALAVETVNFNGSQVVVSSIHLKWPWPHRQPEQLTNMEKAFHEIRAAGRPVLIGGDMNAAPWSAAVGLIADRTATRILPQARGTWLLPALPPVLTRYIGLPIDNILSSDSIGLLRAVAGPHFGSDHLLIFVDFTVVPVGIDEEGQAQPS